LADPGFAAWFAPLEDSIYQLAEMSPTYPPRVIEVQHALIDVLDALDPERKRTRAHKREKI
jgi:hypothetical protein